MFKNVKSPLTLIKTNHFRQKLNNKHPFFKSNTIFGVVKRYLYYFRKNSVVAKIPLDTPK